MIEIPEAQTLAKQSNQFLTGRTMTKVEANHTPTDSRGTPAILHSILKF
ncbi:MAG: hypothetical protein ACLR23_09295 [Clostridia bacterium]